MTSDRPHIWHTDSEYEWDGLYDCHIFYIFVDDIMSNINCGIGVLHVKRQILTYFL